LYTIASSSQKNPNSIHLCVAMQIDTLPYGETRVGLASAFFKRLFDQYNQGKTLPPIKIAVRESTFSIPSEPATPVA